ncbi:hypothetical protein ACOME3_009201 [Neoechinorhynchus agilis]
MMKSMRFADGLNVKVDMNKVNLDLIKTWIAKRILDILDLDDDVVVDFTLNQLEERVSNIVGKLVSDIFKFPDPKLMQINLTGFLGGSSARTFMAELWQLLDSAQQAPDGIPPELIEMKMNEMLMEKESAKTDKREVAADSLCQTEYGASYSQSTNTGHPIPNHRRRQRRGSAYAHSDRSASPPPRNSGRHRPSQRRILSRDRASPKRFQSPRDSDRDYRPSYIDHSRQYIAPNRKGSVSRRQKDRSRRLSSEEHRLSKERDRVAVHSDKSTHKETSLRDDVKLEGSQKSSSSSESSERRKERKERRRRRKRKEKKAKRHSRKEMKKKRKGKKRRRSTSRSDNNDEPSVEGLREEALRSMTKKKQRRRSSDLRHSEDY